MSRNDARGSAPFASRVSWRRTALALICAASFVGGVPAAGAAPSDEEAAGPPESPAEVLQRRRLEGIEDRVRIAISTAGGELEGAEVVVHARPGGRVILEGRVGSERARERATRLARYEVGVQAVEDRLAIDPSIAPTTPPVATGGEGASAPATEQGDGDATAERIPDDELEARVARRVARALSGGAEAEHGFFGGWRVEGEGWRFAVEAEQGRVRLEGSVAEGIGIEAVLAAAREAAPGHEIVTELETTSPEERGFFERLFF